MKMSSLKSFVVLDDDDKENFVKAANLALTLDRVDFSTNAYSIDNKRYPQIGKALLRGKGKAPLVNDNEEDVEAIRGVCGTPSSSTVNLDSDDFLDDVVPLGHCRVDLSVSGDFAWPNRDVDVLNFDHLNILERPSSALASPSGSSAEKRRVVSANAHSPLD